MKIATNTSNWFSFAEAKDTKFSKRDFMLEAKSAGCDGVEICGLGREFEKPEAALFFLQENDLKLAAWISNITYNPYEPCIEAYQKSLEYASKMGVSTVMTCGGFPISPRRNTYDFDYDMFASSLQPMVDFATQLGLTIAYHPHRGCICETLGETQKILDRVPDLRLCVDIAHLAACGDDPVLFIREFGDKIIHTHMKDYSWQRDCFMELGSGDGDEIHQPVDVIACLGALKEVNYTGWLCLELDRKWQDGYPTPMESTCQSIAYLKDHCDV